jgi:IS1 family transposase
MILYMRKLNSEKRAAVLTSLVEGVSVNATARINGVSKVTVLRLLADAGSLARDYHDLTARGLKTTRVEADEIHGYVGARDKAIAKGAVGHGSAWLWVALDSDSKLVISYRLGCRSAKTGEPFILDLASRLAGRVQLTTDGHSVYPPAVDLAFGSNIDYAVLIKQYEVPRDEEARYAAPKCVGCERRRVWGDPDPKLISTSYVERQNLTIRTNMKRMARLTLGYSKSLSNHEAAIHLHMFFYNFVRKHETLKTTPAVAAGIASKPMTMLDFVAMLEREEVTHGGRLTDYLAAR